MVTNSYESQDIGNTNCTQKTTGREIVTALSLTELALPLHIVHELLEKCSHHVHLIRGIPLLLLIKINEKF
jgi:hypothetical protein